VVADSELVCAHIVAGLAVDFAETESEADADCVVEAAVDFAVDDGGGCLGVFDDRMQTVLSSHELVRCAYVPHSDVVLVHVAL